MKTLVTWFAVIVWLVRIVLGAGAGYAALRLWPLRAHPLIWRMAVYIHAFIIEAIMAIVLVVINRGVVFTLKFAVVLFIGTLLGDLVRLPLIVYLIKGPDAVEPSHVPQIPLHEQSGTLPPEYWLNAFREIVREEVERSREAVVEPKT